MDEGNPQRHRVIEAAYACVERTGIGGVTVEAIAHEAGVGRATVYRLFPGGRDELVSAAVTHAVADFFRALGPFRAVVEATAHVIGYALGPAGEGEEPPPLRPGFLALYRRTPRETEAGAVVFAFLGTREMGPGGPEGG